MIRPKFIQIFKFKHGGRIFFYFFIEWRCKYTGNNGMKPVKNTKKLCLVTYSCSSYQDCAPRPHMKTMNQDHSPRSCTKTPQPRPYTKTVHQHSAPTQCKETMHQISHWANAPKLCTHTTHQNHLPQPCNQKCAPTAAHKYIQDSHKRATRQTDSQTKEKNLPKGKKSQNKFQQEKCCDQNSKNFKWSLEWKKKQINTH